MKVILAVFLLASFAVQANECVELTKCIEYVSKLTGKKYIYDVKSTQGGLSASTNFEITSENADSLFTYILNLNDYVRLPIAEKDTYLIIHARDMRYQVFPEVNVNAQAAPQLKPNYDYFMMNYKFKHFDQGQTRLAANSIRPLLSRYARVLEVGSVLSIQENAAKLISFYEVLKSFDRELTKDELKKMKDRDEERKEERKEKKKFDKKEDKK